MARSRKYETGTAPPLQLDPTVLDELLGDLQTMVELFRQMKKVICERALTGELTYHLGYAKEARKTERRENHRNGTMPRTVLTETA